MTKINDSAENNNILAAEEKEGAAGKKEPAAAPKPKRGRPKKNRPAVQSTSPKSSGDTGARLYARIDPADFAGDTVNESVSGNAKPDGARKKEQAAKTARPAKAAESARQPQKKQVKPRTARPTAAAAEKPKTRAKSPANAETNARPTKNAKARQPKAPSRSRGQALEKVTEQTLQAMQAALDLEMQDGAEKAPRKKRGRPSKKPVVSIIPLGGLGEIGKNVTVYECGNDLFIVDCGLAFPDDDMLGIDIVIPDFSYLEHNRDRFRGIVLTHGHEDHIGGLPYLLKDLDVPVYGTRLTLGLVEGKLKEAGLYGKRRLNVVKAGDVVKLGCMSVEFINVNHSIPDACAMAIHTPAGVIVQTGDFKIDFTPIEGNVINLARFGELGRKGVLALLSESTNAERPGSTPSERNVGESFINLFNSASTRRIIIASFSSNIHRIQQIVDTAWRFGRKIAVSGRSMINVVTIAVELGYLRIPKGMLIDVDAVGRYPDSEIVIITTGSQGETMSALTRMAMGEHRKITVTPNDFIIISATPIPGNEKMVNRVVNELMKLGAEVIYEKMYEVHVSGHACQDELKTMLSLTRPKYFIPVHGEYKHLKKHAGLALKMGIDPSHILIANIGDVIETNGDTLKITGSVPSGQVLVDGLGVGDVGSTVIRDRKRLAQDGLIIAVVAINSKTGQILAGPDIVSRGFVYVRESEPMLNEARRIVKNAVSENLKPGMTDWSSLKSKVRDSLDSFLYGKTGRSPMILPVIEDVRNLQ